MKPTRIEPRDVAVTVEITSSELRKLSLYLEKSHPLMDRIYSGSNEQAVKGAMLFVEHELKPMLKELMKHPLIEDFVNGS